MYNKTEKMTIFCMKFFEIQGKTSIITNLFELLGLIFLIKLSQQTVVKESMTKKNPHFELQRKKYIAL